MSDLDRVSELAEKKQLAAKMQAAEQEENSKRLEDFQKQSFAELMSRVETFSKELKGKVGVYISPVPTEKIVVISISSITPWLRKPFGRFTISPGWSFGEYRCRIKLYNKNEESGGSFSLDRVMDELSEVAADFIAKRASINYELPYWYTTVGAIISWPLFAIAWLLLAVVGGFWGAVLGWIPSLILKYCAKYLWLPALGYLVLQLPH